MNTPTIILSLTSIIVFLIGAVADLISKQKRLLKEVLQLEAAIKMNHQTIESLKEKICRNESYISQKSVHMILQNPPKFKIGDQIGNLKIVDIVFKNRNQYLQILNIALNGFLGLKNVVYQRLFVYKVQNMTKTPLSFPFLRLSEAELLEIQNKTTHENKI